jgi:Flp pilus assembly protein TadG
MTDLQSHTPPADQQSADAPVRASRGQILIMYAVMLTAMLGAVGLSVDLGMAFSQRRTMQSAADAGAYAGTRVIARSKPAVPVSAWSEVQAVVSKNTMAVGAISSITCNYVTDSGSVIAPCTATVPSTATGVEVTVRESHPTYFIRVIPGAAKSVSTSATARANVKKLPAPTDGPFLPCTIKTKLADGGGTMNLLIQQNGIWVINPSAINRQFWIYGSQVETCNSWSSRYKGLAAGSLNVNRSIPGWFYYDTGVSAGTITTDVDGPDGCKAGQAIENCVAFLPIAINDPREVENSKQLWVVAFAPFYITRNKNNDYSGMLLSQYIVYGKGQDGNYGWEPGYTGPITIRLTK